MELGVAVATWLRAAYDSPAQKSGPDESGVLTFLFVLSLVFGIWNLFGICPPQADWNLEFALDNHPSRPCAHYPNYNKG
jgi:hypothetical protein